jgi:type IV pilus assembly protein PilA
MHRHPSSRLRHDVGGFTFVEVLIVILIVGILAAIAITAILGQRLKAQDAEAKSAARTLLTQVESCNLDEQDLRKCDTPAQLKVKGLLIGADSGHVEVTGATKLTAIVRGHSRSGNEFRIVRDADGHAARTCDNAGRGACPESASW